MVAIAALKSHVLVKSVTKERKVTLAVQSGNYQNIILDLFYDSIPDPNMKEDQYQ